MSRFPSRWPSTVYVYTERQISISHCSHARVRVTSRKAQPEGLKWSKTLYLNRLPLSTKLKILRGSIEWLFVTEADSRSSTEDSMAETRRHWSVDGLYERLSLSLRVFHELNLSTLIRWFHVYTTSQIYDATMLMKQGTLASRYQGTHLNLL